MVERKVPTAVELEAMNPADRHEIFEASIVWDINEAPAELIARERAKVFDRIERTEVSGQ